MRNPPCLPQISALTLQQGMPPLQNLAVRAHHFPLISILLQGIYIPPLIPSSLRAYAPLLW